MPNKNRFTIAIRRLGLIPVLMVAAFLAIAALSDGAVLAQDAGNVPGQSLGNTSDADFWKEIRKGAQGTVSIPDQQAGVMIQSEGENWRAYRNGPLSSFGAWVIIAMVVVLAAFFALRGRIKIDSGFSGRLIERFNNLERMAHWLTGGTFVVLAITGLNMMYGRYLFGGAPATPGEFGGLHQFFALVTLGGKYAHNYLAFGFMLGLVMIFVLWIKDNIPGAIDLKWIAVGGGLFSKNVHPPARKFNAGQKMIFWVVILGGISMGLSGISLMFPFEFAMFEATFAVLNAIGFALPENLTPMQEMQYSEIWHVLVAMVMIAIIIAHIYIGSLGMEGAFDAMGSGMVDENWAREHHGMWVAEMKGEPAPAGDDPSGGGATVTDPDGAPQSV